MNIKINDTLYPCKIKDNHVDYTWNNRKSKDVTLEMDSATAASLFVDDAAWSTEQTFSSTVLRQGENGEPVLDENGVAIYDTEEHIVETDMSDYCVAGTITDNRDGTVTVKMGKPTDAELLAILMGGN